MKITKNGITVDVGLISIESAEELERIRIGKQYNLKSTTLFSNFIEKNMKDWDYQKVFLKAYSETYEKEVKGEKKIKKISKDISDKLNCPEKLKKEKLNELIKFCINFSNYTAVYNEEIKEFEEEPSYF